MHYLHVWLACAKNSLIREMQYLSNFWLAVLVEIGYVSATIFIFEIFFYQVESIGNWSRGELYLIYGFFRIFSAIGSFFYRANFNRFSYLVNSGEFDYLLLKPISPLFLSTMRITTFSRLSQFFIGIIITFYAIGLIGLPMNFFTVLWIFILLFFGLTTRYAFALVMRIPIFWFERIDNIGDLEFTLFSTARYPRLVFPPILRHLLSYVLPTLLVAAIPTEILLKQTSSGLIIGYITTSIVFFMVSVGLFQLGVKQYNSASS